MLSEPPKENNPQRGANYREVEPKLNQRELNHRGNGIEEGSHRRTNEGDPT